MTSQPSPSSRTSLSRRLVTPYCRVTRFMLLALLAARRSTEPTSSYRCWLSISNGSPRGRLKTASIRSRSPIGCLGRAASPLATSMTRLTSDRASGLRPTRASSSGQCRRISPSAGITTSTVAGDRSTSFRPTSPKTCSPIQQPIWSRKSAWLASSRPGSACQRTWTGNWVMAWYSWSAGSSLTRCTATNRPAASVSVHSQFAASWKCWTSSRRTSGGVIALPVSRAGEDRRTAACQAP